ncbi:flagellin [Alkalihalobacillus macyae]|uniref:flagellin N-terminal helical domain-containing protein n=1 Tax=Guptibacillus hwajinpoensis TaxID=208199 RepID=UPI00273C71D4|nr:flagellin [Alkalihalobacillus macyae]MDP4551445.1 flagellin [Alkalihalobacillus macyae]
MIINHNISAMNTYRQMNTNQSAASGSMEKLSSGLRINRAGDDAAGLAISEKMRGQIRGLDQASRNAQDGISMIQTAEGALTETQSILQRMRELSVQASNDTLADKDRAAIKTEVDALNEEINRISSDTKFNGKLLLDGSLGVSRNGGTLDNAAVGLANLSDIDVTGAEANSTYTLTEVAGSITLKIGATGDSQTLDKSGLTAGDSLNFDSLGVKIKTDSNYNTGGTAFDGLTVTTGTADGATLQIGADSGQDMSVQIGNMSSAGLGVSNIQVDSKQNANDAIDSIDDAIESVSTERSKLGANQNRLEHTINNLNTSSENLTAAESRIRDVDMAKEMMNMTKENIKAQAAQAMLAQANQAPQQVLQLLR